MNKPYHFIIFVLGLVLIYETHQGIIMADKRLDNEQPYPRVIQFKSLDSAQLTEYSSIRLIDENGKLILATLTGNGNGIYSVSAHHIEDNNAISQSKELLQLESLFGLPAWDLVNGDGKIASVWTAPGSAICPLFYQKLKNNPIKVTTHYSMGVFQNPRFMRSQRSRAITAVHSEGTGHFVLFGENFESGHSKFQMIPSKKNGIISDGMILETQEGYLLLIKYLIQNDTITERKDLRGESIRSGNLYSICFNKEWQILSEALMPLGSEAVFEFDASIQKEKLILFATTERGWTVAMTPTNQKELNWHITSQKSLFDRIFLTPSTTTIDDVTSLAVIEQNKDLVSSILIGRLQAQHP